MEKITLSKIKKIMNYNILITNYFSSFTLELRAYFEFPRKNNTTFNYTIINYKIYQKNMRKNDLIFASYDVNKAISKYIELLNKSN